MYQKESHVKKTKDKEKINMSYSHIDTLPNDAANCLDKAFAALFEHTLKKINFNNRHDEFSSRKVSKG